MNDHSTEYLGSRQVQRSAYAEKTARATTIYLGTCKRDNRPVRFEFPANLGPVADVPCFICTLPVRCERLHVVTTNLECDGSCMGARGPICSCGCGGINHGRHWGQGALLDSREVVESALARYRAERVKIKERREAKAEAAARAERNAFQVWAEDHRDIVTALDPWYEHKTDDARQPRHWGAHILVDFAIQTHGGWNGRPKALTDPQIGLAQRILREIAADAERDARRAVERAAKPGAGDQSQLVPGVYKLGGEIYVVKGNRTYVSWRKSCREHGGCARPADARLYAKRLVESAPRITDSGTEIPFTLEYARGVIFELALSDRMPLAEAEELSTRYAKCIVCERTLKAAKSVRASIGPVCIKMFGPVLPEADAA
jgi:hypothetical protein